MGCAVDAEADAEMDGEGALMEGVGDSASSSDAVEALHKTRIYPAQSQ